jgi:hypothetical protein
MASPSAEDIFYLADCALQWIFERFDFGLHLLGNRFVGGRRLCDLWLIIGLDGSL